ncbi:dual specificity protein kinase yak1, partial [Coemansia sp. RSA 2611]
YNQLSRIVDLLGTPPRVMLEKARRTDEFFNYLGPSTWDFKPMEQFSRERNTEEKESKRYFNATTLEELITTYPIRRRMTEPEQEREYQSRFALIDFLRGLLQLDPNRRWSPQQASMHPFITGEALTGSFVPPPISRDPHDPSGATGPYGAAPGDSSGAHHASQTGGGYGQAHTIGYSASRFSGGSGSNGHTAHVPYGGNTSASLFSHAPSPPQPAVSLPGAHDTSGLTWAHQENRPHDPGDSGRGSGGVLSIPGSFPVKSTASHPSQTSQHDGRGRQRATTLGHAGGLASASRIPAESAGGYSYQQPESASGFLGVDPSTSHICGSPTAGGESRDAPGRLDISQSSSEYSADNASHGWASHSDTNYNSNYPSSSSGSNGTRAGSLYEYKVAGPSTSRHYLVNERQQQRLLQQRQLYRSEFGGGSAAVDTSSMGDTQSGSRPDSMILPGSAQRCESLHTSPQQIASAAPAPSQPALGGPTAKPCLPVYAMRLKPSPALRSTAGARLVSNFSPLTLPSTPGSSGYSRRYASSAYDERCSAEPEMVQQFIDLGTSYEEGEDIGHNIDNVSASGSEQGGSRFSEESELSRPLTQMRGSETSLSLHSAASDRDDASSHGCGPDDADYDALSDSDLSSAGGSGCKYSGAPKLGRHTRSDNRWQKLPIPQPAQRKHGVGSTKPSSLPYALSHSLDRTLAEAQHSIYLMPRYAACSQSILGSSGSLYSGGRRASEALSSDLAAKENMQPLALGSDEDWRSDNFDLHDVVDDGSVISQDIVSGSESPPNGQELDEVTDGFVRLDVGRGSSESDSDSQSSALFGSIGRYSESSGLSDADGGDRANQDTVLYVGRRRPGQDSTDASTLLKERGLGTPQSRLSAQDLATMGDRARTSLDSLRLSPSPIPQSIRCAVAATYPQKIMKMSQQERSDRPALLKDSLRMVASLRRMGKWRNADPVQTGDDVSRANQFFYDPVIIAMSPRLMPQPGQPS